MNECWSVREMHGAPVYRIPSNMDRKELSEKLDEIASSGNRITNLHGLLDDMRILVPTLFGQYADARVVGSEIDGCMADSGGSLWLLDWDEEQGCWVTTGGFNKKAMEIALGR